MDDASGYVVDDGGSSENSYDAPGAGEVKEECGDAEMSEIAYGEEIAAPAAGIGHYDLDEPEPEEQEMDSYRVRHADASTGSNSIFCGGDALSFLSCSADAGDDRQSVVLQEIDRSVERAGSMLGHVSQIDRYYPSPSGAAGDGDGRVSTPGSWRKLPKKNPKLKQRNADVPRIYNGAIYAAATMEQVPYSVETNHRFGSARATLKLV